jgi:hypothetical protein
LSVSYGRKGINKIDPSIDDDDDNDASNGTDKVPDSSAAKTSNGLGALAGLGDYCSDSDDDQ